MVLTALLALFVTVSNQETLDWPNFALTFGLGLKVPYWCNQEISTFVVF